jgi:hypothetical protein
MAVQQSEMITHFIQGLGFGNLSLMLCASQSKLGQPRNKLTWLLRAWLVTQLAATLVNHHARPKSAKAATDFGPTTALWGKALQPEGKKVRYRER